MLQGYRTYLVALAAIVVGVLETTDFNKLLNDPKAGLTALVMGVLMAALRYMTQQTTVKDALNAPPPVNPEP